MTSRWIDCQMDEIKYEYLLRTNLILFCRWYWKTSGNTLSLRQLKSNDLTFINYPVDSYPHLQLRKSLHHAGAYPSGEGLDNEGQNDHTQRPHVEADGNVPIRGRQDVKEEWLKKQYRRAHILWADTGFKRQIWRTNLHRTQRPTEAICSGTSKINLDLTKWPITRGQVSDFWLKCMRIL